ncbi:MAG: hypothetical protein WKF81_11920 [Thermomicrobiales bacterium]
MDIRSYTSAVPEMERFLTVDELNADFARLASEYPDITSLERVDDREQQMLTMPARGTGS